MNAQKFRFILVGLILLALGAGGTAAYLGLDMLRQRVDEAARLKIDTEANRQAYLSAKEAEQQLSDLDIARLETNLEKVVPDNAYANQFIADVNKYAADSGVRILALSYAEAGGSSAGGAPVISGTAAVPLQLTLGENTAYDDLITFVDKLETNLQHVQVLTLTMQPQAGDRTVLASAALSLALYVEPK